jgi:hypothetical protein
MSHMSVLGACWTKVQFWEKAIFGEKRMKEKTTRVREACEVRMQGRPNDIRVRVFAEYGNG